MFHWKFPKFRDPAEILDVFKWCLCFHFSISELPANIFWFKLNNKKTQLAIKTPERSHWRRSGVYIDNFEHVSPLFLVFLLMALNKYEKMKRRIMRINVPSWK